MSNEIRKKTESLYQWNVCCEYFTINLFTLNFEIIINLIKLYRNLSVLVLMT